MKTVRLAQEAGATINISYQAVTCEREVPAGTGHGAVRGRCSRTWSRSGLHERALGRRSRNEPNRRSAAVTLAEYNALDRALDAELVARGLATQIRLMGPDLVENAGRAHALHLVAVHRREHGRRPRRLVGAHVLGLLERRRTHRVPAQGRAHRSSPRSCRRSSGSRPTSWSTASAASQLRGQADRRSRARTGGDGDRDGATNIGAFQQFWFDHRVGAARVHGRGRSGTRTGAMYDRTLEPRRCTGRSGRRRRARR